MMESLSYAGVLHHDQPQASGMGMTQFDVFKLLADQEEANTVHARHYNEALVLLSKLGDVTSCIRILSSMLSRDMKVHRTTMNGVIAACAKAGNGEGAERWWRQMLQMGQSPNRATYASVIHAWAKAGDMKRAEEWLLAMKSAGYSPAKGFCRPIAHILLQANVDKDEDEATNFPLQEVNFIQREVSEVEIVRADRATKWLLHFSSLGVLLDRSTINLLLSVYARNAEAEKAEQWIHNMIQVGISPNQSTFHALILAHIHAGSTNHARTWLAQMQKMGFEAGPAVLEALDNGNRGSGVVGRSVGEAAPRGVEIGNGEQQRQQQWQPLREGLPLEAVRAPNNLHYGMEPGHEHAAPWPEAPAASWPGASLPGRGNLPGREGHQSSASSRSRQPPFAQQAQGYVDPLLEAFARQSLGSASPPSYSDQQGLQQVNGGRCGGKGAGHDKDLTYIDQHVNGGRGRGNSTGHGKGGQGYDQWSSAR